MTVPFTPEKKYPVDISVFPFITQVEIRTFREAFLLSNVKTSFLCILFRNFLHLRFFLILQIARILGWFPYFKTAVVVQFSVLSMKGSYSVILKS